MIWLTMHWFLAAPDCDAQACAKDCQTNCTVDRNVVQNAVLLKAAFVLGQFPILPILLHGLPVIQLVQPSTKESTEGLLAVPIGFATDALIFVVLSIR